MFTDQARVENYLQRELTANEGAQIDDIIEYISGTVATYTGRDWLPIDDDGEIEASERIYDGDGSKDLYTADFSDLEKVEILDQLGTPYQTIDDLSDYSLSPSNTSPKYGIFLISSHFPRGRANIKITAKWGSGEVPNDIVVVTTALVAKYLQKSAQAGVQYSKESIEGYSYEIMSGSQIDTDASNLMSTLDKWKKIRL